MPTTRRSVLCGLQSVALVGLGGCASQLRDDAPTNSTSKSPSTADENMVDIHNGMASSVTVHLTVTTGPDPVTEQTVDVPADEWMTIHSEISEIGTYEFTVVVDDGPSKSRTISFDEYALETGSNVLVDIQSDDIEYLIEE